MHTPRKKPQGPEGNALSRIIECEGCRKKFYEDQAPHITCVTCDNDWHSLCMATDGVRTCDMKAKVITWECYKCSSGKRKRPPSQPVHTDDTVLSERKTPRRRDKLEPGPTILLRTGVPLPRESRPVRRAQLRLTKRKAAYSNAHKAATARWDGLAQMPLPDNHTNLKVFELEDENGVKVPNEEPYRIGDDIFICTYIGPDSARKTDYPARIVAIRRSEKDGAISLVVAWYYSCGDIEKIQMPQKAQWEQLRTVRKESFYTLSNHLQSIESTAVNGRVKYDDLDGFHRGHVLLLCGTRYPQPAFTEWDDVDKSDDQTYWWDSNVRCRLNRVGVT